MKGYSTGDVGSMMERQLAVASYLTIGMVWGALTGALGTVHPLLSLAIQSEVKPSYKQTLGLAWVIN